MMKLNKWVPFELHTHTIHSDGKLSLIELAEYIKRLGLNGFALTDHNTNSGFNEIKETESKSGISIIRGIELTTFFGHMLVLGINHYVDWRDLTTSNLISRIKEVHSEDGIVGIAHPFRPGSPMCTGCYWKYAIDNWSEIDYLEVWSRTFPSNKRDNLRAFRLWTDLLNQGYKITAVSGLDLHYYESKNDPIASTYIKNSGNELRNGEKIIESLRNGSVIVSMGPLLTFNIFSINQNMEWCIGDIVYLLNDSVRLGIKINIDLSVKTNHWEIEYDSLKVKLNSNLGYLNENKIKNRSGELIYELDIPRKLLWMRAELFGIMYGTHVMIAFTNPIYFKFKI
ncbi:MAG: hypothetical protein PWR08_1804 [Thermoanaerobacterium sp.]|nr:hypothetical protein [Thermoanaerobacterium sp.]MDN5317679.1 hypothetical protein [Thermoanaerobacterium sp.]